jgi:dipeptidyl aminopeptidase/acylaminoacyl peptidase
VCVIAVASSAHATFPGANGKIAFSSSGSIHTVNPDGTGEQPIAGGANVAWSADGTKIAYQRGASIFVANADGSGATNIGGTGSAGPGATDPAWSPDGRIAYDSSRIECNQYDCFIAPDGIFVMNSDGSDDHRLTTHGEEPAWSPDGKKIAFSDYDVSGSNSTTDIYVMNADGAGVTDLTQDYFYHEESPSWSPDGSKIAFTRIDRFSAYGQLWTMKVDGTGFAFVLGRGGSQISDHDPAWSPDGTRIAFESDRPGSSVVATVDPSGANQTDIAFADAFYAAPDWQPIVNRPPDCSGVAASRPVLTTANHSLVAITLDGATDPDGDSVTLSVDGVTQDEPVVGQGDHSSPDAVDQGDGELRVRAERNQHGDGRVYRIAFTASDGRGGSCSGTTTVSVPRKRHKAAVDSAPPSYDSFAP